MRPSNVAPGGRAGTCPYGQVPAPTGNCRRFLTQLRIYSPARRAVHRRWRPDPATARKALARKTREKCPAIPRPARPYSSPRSGSSDLQRPLPACPTPVGSACSTPPADGPDPAPEADARRSDRPCRPAAPANCRCATHRDRSDPRSPAQSHRPRCATNYRAVCSILRGSRRSAKQRAIPARQPQPAIHLAQQNATAVRSETASVEACDNIAATQGVKLQLRRRTLCVRETSLVVYGNYLMLIA